MVSARSGSSTGAWPALILPDLLWIDVNADNREAALGESGRHARAQFAESEDRDGFNSFHAMMLEGTEDSRGVKTEACRPTEEGVRQNSSRVRRTACLDTKKSLLAPFLRAVEERLGEEAPFGHGRAPLSGSLPASGERVEASVYVVVYTVAAFSRDNGFQTKNCVSYPIEEDAAG